jgi:hypothetical protein
MMDPETTVGIVLDRSFGDRLLGLPPRMPVWIIDTPPNRGSVQSLRTGDPARSISTFVDVPSDSAEDLLIGMLPTIDLHHGEYSQDPPYSALQVFGATPTLQVREALEEYNLVIANETPHQFGATRSSAPR